MLLLPLLWLQNNKLLLQLHLCTVLRITLPKLAKKEFYLEMQICNINQTCDSSKP